MPTGFLAKIAVSQPAPPPQTRRLATGDGWAVSEIVCSLGPRDRPFEEQHSSVAIAIVAAGTFQYRSRSGRDVMTPGSLMLGGVGQTFECSHEHGAGDRCLSFSYAPAFFERLAADPVFRNLRVPPVRAISPLIARATAALAGSIAASWEELAIELAARAVSLDRGHSSGPPSSPSAISKVTRLLRAIECDPACPHDLSGLARLARLSPYHFLRTFENVTGVTPHQYLLRRRLRLAALRLRTGPDKIVNVALDCGFGDLSNFNRTFRAEFGVTPRAWRKSSTSSSASSPT